MNRYYGFDKDSVARPKISRTKLLPIDFMPDTSQQVRASHHCLEPSSAGINMQQLSQPVTGKPENRKSAAQSKRSKRYMNPLVDARRNIKMMEEFNVKISQDIEKLKKLQPSVLVESTIEADNLLVLSSQTYHRGTLKIVLHVPSFCINFLEEQPIRQNYCLQTLEDSSKRWKKAVEGSYKLDIHGHLWNNPEGFVSLMYDYTESYTIQQLLYEFGYLPENVIQYLAAELVSGIIKFAHEKIIYWNQIIPEQVKISTKTWKVQFHPSIDLFCREDSQHNDSILNRLMMIELISKKPIPEKQTSFKLGYLFFVCALGKFTYDEEVQQVIETVLNQQSRIIKNKPAKHDKVVDYEGTCCLVHLLDAISGTYCHSAVNLRRSMPMYSIRRMKWSDEFVDFLCGCLRFNELYRLTPQQIKIHHFLVEKNLNSKKVEIRDFIKELQAKSSAVQINTIMGNNKLEYFCQQIDKIASKKGTVSPNLNQNVGYIEVISKLTGKSVSIVNKVLQKIYSKF